MTESGSGNKVFVMMSGGVDSSVAAAVLQEQGYEVIGVFMKCWSIEQLESLGAEKSLYGCFWEEDVEDARLVAGRLNIPFYVWDFEKEYKNGVVDYMLREYASGRTPNPDVMCNSTIKFGIFYQRAMELGADFVATGHYAKRQDLVDFANYYLKDNNETGIGRGKDANKDQSYFLWRLPAQVVSKTLFPIGEFETKQAVRLKAESLNLITAAKKDSQGLCFIGETPLRDLLLQTLGSKQGQILDMHGKVLGQHPGAYLYTVGQRTGLGLSGGPWFVVETDITQNLVKVAHQSEESYLFKSELQVSDLNWLVNLPSSSFKAQAQIRYRQKAVDCKVEIKPNNSADIVFDEPVRAVSKGQSIVFYDNELMLGGGVIN
ncbi:MAG: tRNA 2-thiouridine(34) synthase MnmA [Patescibacteria group bacterium]